MKVLRSKRRSLREVICCLKLLFSYGSAVLEKNTEKSCKNFQQIHRGPQRGIQVEKTTPPPKKPTTLLAWDADIIQSLNFFSVFHVDTIKNNQEHEETRPFEETRPYHKIKRKTDNRSEPIRDPDNRIIRCKF